MTKKTYSLGLLIALCAALVGCAHPITMAPDLKTVQPAVAAPLIPQTVGFHISDASKALEVTTPGGGGDKVRYFPYRDLEPGIYKALSAVFRDVTKISNLQDMASVQQKGISLIVVPDIATTSSSPSPLTWPPTQFTVTLVCTVRDSQGKTVDTLTVQGAGQAEFDEFKSNFSLAAVRASEDALQKLMVALRASPAVGR